VGALYPVVIIISSQVTLALCAGQFNAADVLKEVSVFDTVDPGARYSSKVWRLGDFCKLREIGDIDDPLYGNMGGADEPG